MKRYDRTSQSQPMPRILMMVFLALVMIALVSCQAGQASVAQPSQIKQAVPAAEAPAPLPPKRGVKLETQGAVLAHGAHAFKDWALHQQASDPDGSAAAQRLAGTLDQAAHVAKAATAGTACVPIRTLRSVVAAANENAATAMELGDSPFERRFVAVARTMTKTIENRDVC